VPGIEATGDGCSTGGPGQGDPRKRQVGVELTLRFRIERAVVAGSLAGWVAASSAICFLSDKQQKKSKNKTQASATHTLISPHWVLLLEEETICFLSLWSCVDVIIILCCNISFAHIAGSCSLIVVVTLQDFGLLGSGKPRERERERERATNCCLRFLRLSKL
jgi:hypothetical protein